MQIQEASNTQRTPNKRVLIATAIIAIGLLIAAGILIPGRSSSAGIAGVTSGQGQLLVLALPTFLAGIFSFLSPCTLPILPAYFAFTFAARRQQVALMTLAFFLGLATTMTILGASLSLLGGLVHQIRGPLTQIGGLLIIGLGIMSILGKGFGGITMSERPASTFAGTYLYGMTFALGWTACIGPILGTLLTLLVTQGGTVLTGAVLAFIYALGLALPLFLVAVFFSKLGAGTRFWQVARGRGWQINLGGHSLFIHSTSLISGLLLVAIGLLLATNRIAYVSTLFAGNTDLGGQLQDWLARVFHVGY
ncbi:MAG: cytochrome c biogenesis CcdA family protein [Herpetosiphon sp.]